MDFSDRDKERLENDASDWPDTKTDQKSENLGWEDVCTIEFMKKKMDFGRGQNIEAVSFSLFFKKKKSCIILFLVIKKIRMKRSVKIVISLEFHAIYHN